MKRVKQISIDILVDDSVDGFNLASEVNNALESQFIILGCGFTEDLTKVYMEQYPDLMGLETERELLLEKGELGLWKVSYGLEECYRITDDGSGICNSIEEMCEYYGSEEVKLVNIILEKGNYIMFVNKETLDDCTYEEYIAQFEDEDGEYSIFPYVDFDTYEKAKEILDLLK